MRLVAICNAPLVVDLVDELAACSLRLVSTIVPFPLNARHDLVLPIGHPGYATVPACSAIFAAVALLRGRTGGVMLRGHA